MTKKKTTEQPVEDKKVKAVDKIPAKTESKAYRNSGLGVAKSK